MSEEWSAEELEIAVKQYWKAIRQNGAEREIHRAAFVKGALKAGLSRRGSGSVSQRMCNISAVLDANNQPWVIGWKPLRNVGTGVTPRIEALLRKHDIL